MLGDRNAAGRNHEGNGGRYVEEFEWSPPVPQQSMAEAGAFMVAARCLKTFAAALISSAVSPRWLRPIKNAPIWAGDAFPSSMSSMHSAISVAESGERSLIALSFCGNVMMVS